MLCDVSNNQEKRKKKGKVMVSASTGRSVFKPSVTLGFHYVNVLSLLASGLYGVHLDLRRQAENVKRIILSSNIACLTGGMFYSD